MRPDAEVDRAHMRHALELARRGWARVRPNPMVGAVVVRDGLVVGEGWHAEYGGPHAEVMALRAAGEAARDATLYVTLEPCSHHGLTPPCTDVIERAGVRRVVCAATDPNPLAMGGAAHLRRAGIDVDMGVEQDAARALNAEFFHVHERGTTFVALKLALSLDGRLSARAGAPSAVTGAAAQLEVHRLRAGFDAIMIGAGTARADDPRLTARGEPHPRRAPLRLVVDSSASLSPDSRLVRTASDAPVVVICGAEAPEDRVDALRARGVRVEPVRTIDGRVDLAALVALLWRQGVRAVLCEGGGGLASALLARELVARLYLFLAPRFYGEAGAPGFAFGSAAPEAAWRLYTHERFGDDVALVYDRLAD